jgi:hypothetical protein
VTPALALLALGQTVMIWRMSKHVRAVARVNERLSHFAEALALLADTTEAGLANVAQELERTGGRRAARASARSASKRITTAVRRGRSIEEIAANEALSESEVRLHLQLATDEEAKGALNGPLRV